MKGTNIENSVLNATMKNVTDYIKNIRNCTINICYTMKNIKKIIYEGQVNGKYKIDYIMNSCGLDTYYLVKMKEEMNFLRDGHINTYMNFF